MDHNNKRQQTPLHTFPLSTSWKSPIASVRNATFYNFFGAVSALKADRSSAIQFCTENCILDENALESSIVDFIDATHADCLGTYDEKQSCHVTIFLWKAEPKGFGKPAWHRDGPLHPMTRGSMAFTRSKYSTTLKGQPTRVLVNTSNVINTATEVYDKDLRYDDMARIFEKAGFDKTQCEDIKTGQLVRFTWEGVDCPVHAEPMITEDRVFLSVIYGTEIEIKGLAEWREEPYHNA
jgi:hypothetical protein